MGDVSKLPKWAQSHIRDLETRVQKLEADAGVDQIDSAPITIGNYQNEVPLPNDPVTFHLSDDPNKRLRMQIRAHLHMGELVVMGGSPLVVRLEASNHMRLSTER